MTLTHELLIDYREALYEGLGLDPDDEASDGVLSPVALRGQILGWQWRAERLESELDATRAAMLRLCEAVASKVADDDVLAVCTCDMCELGRLAKAAREVLG